MQLDYILFAEEWQWHMRINGKGEIMIRKLPTTGIETLADRGD
jgi:hypothetical protein